MENTSDLSHDEKTPRLFSVGHSNHDPAAFLALLRGAGIDAVADVRSAPYSRRQPHFSRSHLEPLLKANGVAYVFLGDLLGGRPTEAELYDADGCVDYLRVRATPFFGRGLERLLAGMEKYTIAMMCGEADPLDCHRGLMITPALGERGIRPLHLRRDGTVETTDEMEQRLLAATGVGAGILDGMFAAQVSPAERRELVEEAYRRMAKKKGFRDESASGSEPS